MSVFRGLLSTRRSTINTSLGVSFSTSILSRIATTLAGARSSLEALDVLAEEFVHCDEEVANCPPADVRDAQDFVRGERIVTLHARAMWLRPVCSSIWRTSALVASSAGCALCEARPSSRRAFSIALDVSESICAFGSPSPTLHVEHHRVGRSRYFSGIVVLCIELMISRKARRCSNGSIRKNAIRAHSASSRSRAACTRASDR